MTAASIGDLSPMALKCMEFCQALTSQGMMFSFTLSTGNGFSFSLDTKESEKPASVVAEQVKKKKKKKLSPSDVRRNQRRRQEFLKRKSEGRTDESSAVLQTPEKERAPHQVADLQLTPLNQQRNEEDTMPSSLPSPPSTLPLVCDLVKYGSIIVDEPCGQTFSSEEELRVHAHLGGHFTCTRERYSTPCPWDGCIFHEKK